MKFILGCSPKRLLSYFEKIFGFGAHRASTRVISGRLWWHFRAFFRHFFFKLPPEICSAIIFTYYCPFPESNILVCYWVKLARAPDTYSARSAHLKILFFEILDFRNFLYSKPHILGPYSWNLWWSRYVVHM